MDYFAYVLSVDFHVQTNLSDKQNVLFYGPPVYTELYYYKTKFSDLMTYQAKKFISWSHSFGKMIKENDQLNSWINQRCKSRPSRDVPSCGGLTHPFSAVLTLETNDQPENKSHGCSRSNSLLTKRITGNTVSHNRKPEIHPVQRNSKKPPFEAKQQW